MDKNEFSYRALSFSIIMIVLIIIMLTIFKV